MRKTMILAGVASLLAAPAYAQSAKEIFSYNAPGIYSEGTTKWNMYKFMFEDAERTAALNRGRDVTATGTVTGETNTAEQNLPRSVERRGKRVR